MNKEECLQKILNDDNKYVQNLIQKEDEVSSNNIIITTLSSGDRRESTENE